MRALTALALCTGVLVLASPSWASPCGLPDPANKPIAIGGTHLSPPYPMISIRLGEQGVTVIRVEIGADGSVLDDFVRRSSGSDRLDHAALDYVKQNWRWKPPSSNCRPVAAATDVTVGWSLTRDHSGTAPEVTRPLPPLPASIHSMPPDQQKLALARYLIAQIQRAHPQQKELDLASAPAVVSFKARLIALPDAQQRFALAAFQNSLDETLNVRQAETESKLSESIAEHMDLESIKALVTFYATPLGQKSLTAHSTMTPEERRKMGEFVLAHPGTLELFVPVLRVLADKAKTMKQDRVTFISNFQGRLCTKLATFNIRDPICLRPLPLSPAMLKPEPCEAGNCDAGQPVHQLDVSNENVGKAAPSAAAPAPPQPTLAAQTQGDSCSEEERQVAELARKNGYHYAGVCK